MMLSVTEILYQMLLAIRGYLVADGLILAIGILVAAGINAFSDPNRLRKLLENKTKISLPAAVGLGAFTPLCACGTMAVILSMLASALPLGPVVAFLVSSPLTSPSDFLLEGAVLGWPFATAMIVASLAMGLGGGLLASWMEKNTQFFKGQLRFKPSETMIPLNQAQSLDSVEASSGPTSGSCGCQTPVLLQKSKWQLFVKEIWETGIKKILFFFIIFIALGKGIELLIPQAWIMSLFGQGHAYSIPLAAALGLPLYLTDASALPIMKSMIQSGASQGAVLAFLIAGKATGVPVMAGLMTIMKKKMLAAYIGFIYVSAVVAGIVFLLVQSL